jgi:O-antigen biosynthesis protein WbqV
VAGQDDRGGVYMIEPGRPLGVVELARRLHEQLRVEGQSPAPLAIDVIGLRLGERRHEQLTYPDESRRATDQPCVYRLETSDSPVSLGTWLDELDELRRRLYDWEPAALREHLFALARDGRPGLALVAGARGEGAGR